MEMIENNAGSSRKGSSTSEDHNTVFETRINNQPTGLEPIEQAEEAHDSGPTAIVRKAKIKRTPGRSTFQKLLKKINEDPAVNARQKRKERSGSWWDK